MRHLTDERLAEIRRRLDLIFGDWHVFKLPDRYPPMVAAKTDEGDTIIAEELDEEDAEFIAAAPTDMRVLLEAVEALREENAHLRVIAQTVCELDLQGEIYDSLFEPDNPIVLKAWADWEAAWQWFSEQRQQSRGKAE